MVYHTDTKKYNLSFNRLTFMAFVLLTGCRNGADSGSDEDNRGSTGTASKSAGCVAQTYPPTETSLYVLPYIVGQNFSTGLTNCSSSYHSAGQPDQYAFDFNMPLGTTFVAARSGTVMTVVETESSNGGGGSSGNYVIISHGDDTYGIYLHSPENGITVNEGDLIKQGDALGITGQSGYAGYPHLHFIAVRGTPKYPYEGLAVSFRNALPNDIVLQGNTPYEARPYAITD